MPSLPPGVLPTTNMTIPFARQQGMLARWQWRRSGLQSPLHQLGHRVGHGHHLSFIEHKSRDRHVSCMHGSRDADVQAEFMAPWPRVRPRSRPPPGLGACMSVVQGFCCMHAQDPSGLHFSFSGSHHQPPARHPRPSGTTIPGGGGGGACASKCVRYLTCTSSPAPSSASLPGVADLGSTHRHPDRNICIVLYR